MNKKHKYNQRIISELCKKYNVEADTVRKSLRGDRTSETSENIKKDYYKALNALNKVTRYIYTLGEQKPKYLGMIYLRQNADYSDTGVDFIVLIPNGLKYNKFEVKALIDFYKLASKRYKIEHY